MWAPRAFRVPSWAPSSTPPCAEPGRVSPPLHWSSVGRPGRARGIAFQCVSAEGHQGRARACHVRFVLMCPREPAWPRGSAAACKVVRARKPLLL